MSAVHVVAASLGGVAQLVGFALVLREARRLARTELGRIDRFGKLAAAMKETILNPAPAFLKGAAAEAKAGAQALVTAPLAAPETPTEKLQRRLGELERDLRLTQEQFAAQTRDVRKRVDDIAMDYEKRIDELQETRKTDIERTIRNARIGAYVFLFGVALNLIASLVV
jgi:hypothetical protein